MGENISPISRHFCRFTCFQIVFLLFLVPSSSWSLSSSSSSSSLQIHYKYCEKPRKNPGDHVWENQCLLVFVSTITDVQSIPIPCDNSIFQSNFKLDISFAMNFLFLPWLFLTAPQLRFFHTYILTRWEKEAAATNAGAGQLEEQVIIIIIIKMIIIIIIAIIIISRPWPAFGRQGLVGLSGGYTYHG